MTLTTSIFQTCFDIVPVSKLVSMTQFLCCAEKFKRFTLCYILSLLTFMSYSPGNNSDLPYYIGYNTHFFPKKLLKVWVRIVHRKKVLRCFRQTRSCMKTADALIEDNRKSLQLLNYLIFYGFNLFNLHRVLIS